LTKLKKELVAEQAETFERQEKMWTNKVPVELFFLPPPSRLAADDAF